MCEIMFEKYETAGYFVSKDSVLSCYACGKTSGLVVDASDSGILVSPVQDGWCDLKGVTRSIVGGRLIDAHVTSILKKRGINDIRPLYRLKKNVVKDPIKY